MPSRADTLRDLVTDNPRAIPIFEELRLDYCCGGARPLADACAEAGVDPDVVLERLRALATPAAKAEQSLSELIEGIVERHHRFTRESIATLRLLGAKVLRAHGVAHPELAKVNEAVAALIDDLEPHLLREENVLFPAIIALEARGAWPLPMPIAAPLTRMNQEHDDVGRLLAALRKLTGEYTPPADACPSFQAFYRTLEELERDLHVHIHLENNVLFPRAVALSNSSSRGA